MSVGKEEIIQRFGYHASTDESRAKHEQVRDLFIGFCLALDELLPDGRAKMLAFTALQETSMWTNFGIASDTPVVYPNPADEFDVRKLINDYLNKEGPNASHAMPR